MNILIIGCGRVGSELAEILDKRGHDVSVVDRSSENLDSLPGDFSGRITTGVPIDTSVLKEAGIELCDAVCAVTQDDDLNIMAAQIAKDIFKVERVFARIADVDKVDVFKGFGIHTVCPTKLTVQSACAAVEDVSSETEVFLEHNSVRFITMKTPPEYVGSLPGDIELEPDESLFAMIRPNGMFILYTGQVITLSAEDKLIFAKKV